ncbi:RNA polymerase sigma-70 factor [Pedobacter nutrimenti]|uniref:RNA polymerase sigma-70 factor n=1 Tax=Pedobacter nutrimenti TaxID=1241337 RepID=UPI00292DC2AE|nr:RNA polymerase sigma-70 factor [Pedobacter nutrimenti]
MDSYKALSDGELVHLLRQDDDRALSELYLRYWDKMLVVAFNRLGEPEEAEEIVQDIFFWLWQNRKKLEIRHSFATYISVAVQYRVIDKLDKLYRLHRRGENAALYSDQHSPSPEQYLLAKELRDQLEAAVINLPEKCQIIFRMSREQGQTYKQIATELGVAEKTVEAHMSKALRDIRSNLTSTLPALIFYLIEKDHF